MKMNLFDLFARKRQPEIDRHARELYEMLRDEKYTESPYQKEDMGDDMWIVKQLMWDYWKPRYMVDERNRTSSWTGIATYRRWTSRILTWIRSGMYPKKPC